MVGNAYSSRFFRSYIPLVLIFSGVHFISSYATAQALTCKELLEEVTSSKSAGNIPEPLANLGNTSELIPEVAQRVINILNSARPSKLSNELKRAIRRMKQILLSDGVDYHLTNIASAFNGALPAGTNGSSFVFVKPTIHERPYIRNPDPSFNIYLLKPAPAPQESLELGRWLLYTQVVSRNGDRYDLNYDPGADSRQVMIYLDRIEMYTKSIDRDFSAAVQEIKSAAKEGVSSRFDRISFEVDGIPQYYLLYKLSVGNAAGFTKKDLESLLRFALTQ